MENKTKNHNSERAKSIGLIGFGNFGKLICKHLTLNGINVFVTDVSNKAKEAKELGIEFVSLDEVCKQEIIILAVPMENFREVLNKIKDKLREGTLILDVCSLKMFSCDLMNKILPTNIKIIGTHPLFGPQSCPNSIEGMKIVLVNVRVKQETFAKVKEFCENLGLKVIISTAEEHDKQMAFSQALTHFIGQICNKINIQRVNMSTKTFGDLMNIVDIIRNDTPALFNNMQTINPFAKEVRWNFVNAAKELDAKLNSKRAENV